MTARNVEGNGRDYFKVQLQNLSGGTEQNHNISGGQSTVDKKPNRDLPLMKLEC